MNNQLDLFDLSLGLLSKEHGMSLAASNKRAQLEFARSVAREIAMNSPLRECYIDPVQKVCIERGISLGNAAGSVFKSPEWTFTGKFVRSSRISNHASIRRVWRLR